jgi:hypothetical protein
LSSIRDEIGRQDAEDARKKGERKFFIFLANLASWRLSFPKGRAAFPTFITREASDGSGVRRV